MEKQAVFLPILGQNITQQLSDSKDKRSSQLPNQSEVPAGRKANIAPAEDLRKA